MAAPQQFAQVQPPSRGGALRALAAVACVVVIVAGTVLTVLALRVLDTQADVDRAAERFERSSRDLEPAIDELRDAARALRESGAAAGEVQP